MIRPELNQHDVALTVTIAGVEDPCGGAYCRRRRARRLLRRQHGRRPPADRDWRLARGEPATPDNSSGYPAVHDVPPARPTTVLTDAEQTKLEGDLVAARNRAAEAAKSAAAADKP